MQVFVEKKLHKVHFSHLSIGLWWFYAVKLGIESLSLRFFCILQENNFPILVVAVSRLQVSLLVMVTKVVEPFVGYDG